MIIIDSKYYYDLTFDDYITIDKVYYTYRHERELIVSACKNNVNILKEWFNIIGIIYDTLVIREDGSIVYTVNKERLSLEDLSSGEQTLLYMLAYKALNKKIVVVGLLERLQTRLTKVLVEQFKDYDLIIVMHGSALKECTIPYYKKRGGMINV